MAPNFSKVRSELKKAIDSHGFLLFTAYKKLVVEALSANAEIAEDTSETDVRRDVLEFIQLRLRNVHSPFTKMKNRRRRQELDDKMRLLLTKPAVKRLGLTWIAGKYYPRVLSRAEHSLESAQEFQDQRGGNEETLEKYERRFEEIESSSTSILLPRVIKERIRLVFFLDRDLSRYVVKILNKVMLIANRVDHDI
jgi:hypothetical protein